MRYLNNKIYIFFLILILSFNSFCNEVFIKEKVVEILNTFLVDENFDIVEFKSLLSDSAYIYHDQWYGNFITIKKEANKIKFLITLNADLKLLIFKKSEYSEKNNFSKETTKKDVKFLENIKKSRKILSLFFSDSEKRFSLKKIDYDQSEQLLYIYYISYIDNYPVAETICFGMDESKNILYYSAWISDETPENINIILNKDEAESIARKFLEKRLKIKAESIRVADKNEYKDITYIREWVRLVDHNKPVLVHPNASFLYLDEIYDTPEYNYGGYYEEKKTLRPAYIFVFRHEWKASPGKDDYEFTLIYVDAETGEILGGF